MTTTQTDVIPLRGGERLHHTFPTHIPAVATPPNHWETERLCAHHPHKWWTSDRGHHKHVNREAESLLRHGQTICVECPSQPECLAYAIAAGENQNTWGGVAEWERRTLRAKLRRTGRSPIVVTPLPET